MTDPLLPPDPSKRAWYWLWRQDIGPVLYLWQPPPKPAFHGLWSSPGRPAMTGAWATQESYSLASPHPIPTPEELDALHEAAKPTPSEWLVSSIEAMQQRDVERHGRESRGTAKAGTDGGSCRGGPANTAIERRCGTCDYFHFPVEAGDKSGACTWGDNHLPEFMAHLKRWGTPDEGTACPTWEAKEP